MVGPCVVLELRCEYLFSPEIRLINDKVNIFVKPFFRIRRYPLEKVIMWLSVSLHERKIKGFSQSTE